MAVLGSASHKASVGAWREWAGENRGPGDGVPQDLSARRLHDRGRVVGVMNEAARACNPEDGLAQAEAAVSRAKVCRLPAIDEAERTAGLPPLDGRVRHPGRGSKRPPPMHRVGEISPAACVPGATHSRPPLLDGAPSLRSPPNPAQGARPRGRGGRLLDAAKRKRGPSPVTVALRWCSGCGRFLGVKLWPRASHALVHTHGLCAACLGRITSDEFADPVLLGAGQVGGAGDEPPPRNETPPIDRDFAGAR